MILADGRKIDVTDAKNGQLASQGQTAIIKTADDRLVYRGEDTDPGIMQAALNTLVVPRGGQYKLTLPDGTLVWMNSASSLIFPAQFTGSTREVQLRGEAYFEVAKNAKMPFHVKLNKMEVEVLGTHFNIMAYEDEPVIKTTLLEGSVKLSNSSGHQLLRPGEEGILNQANRFVVRSSNGEEALAWKNGRFIFNDEDMMSISRKLARWYDINLTDERKNKGLTYTGTISRFKNVSEVMKMLELTGTMHYRIENRKITVTQP